MFPPQPGQIVRPSMDSGVNDWLANLIADSVTPATDRIVDAREPRRRLSLKEVGCTSHWL